MFETTVKSAFFLLYLFSIQTNYVYGSSIFRENSDRTSLEFENKADEVDITDVFLEKKNENLAAEVIGVVGQSVDLPCYVDESTCGKPYFITWTKKLDPWGWLMVYVFTNAVNKPLQDFSNPDRANFYLHQDSAYLRISPLRIGDAGTYKCEVQYLQGTCPSLSYVTLTVNDVCDEDGISQCEVENKQCDKKEKNGYKCGGCLDAYFDNGDGNCILVTCENHGNAVCAQMNRVCYELEHSTEVYECGECKDGYVEDMDRKKCVYATCATKGNKLCGDLNRTCNTISQTEYECGGCISGYFPVENSTACTKVTCENHGNAVCAQTNRVCYEYSTEDYECGECQDGYVEDMETKKCVYATCATNGNKLCGGLNRTCNTISQTEYECGGCISGYFPVENSTACTKEYITTTAVQSTPSNWSPTFDENTNSTTDDDISKTEPSNFTGDSNRTTAEVPMTKTTAVDSTASVASNTTDHPTTPTDTAKPTKVD